MVTKKEVKNLARIEKVLAMPKWKFILGFGLISGIIAVIVSALIDMLFFQIKFADIFSNRIWQYIITAAIVCPLAGFIMHRSYQKEYKRIKDKMGVS